jgi:hypothetical protein
MASSATTTTTAATDGDHGTISDEEWRKLLIPNPSIEQIVEVIRTHYFAGTDDSNNNSNDDGNGGTTKPVVQIKVIKELDSYDDKNVWLSINGTDYVAKVHNGVESKDLIDRLYPTKDDGPHQDDDDDNSSYKHSAIHLQNAMMIHLNEHGITTNLPQQPVVGSSIRRSIRSSSSSNDGDGDRSDSSERILLPTPAVICSLPVVMAGHSPKDLVVRLLGWVPGRPMSTFSMLPLEAIADAGRFLGKLSMCLQSLSTTNLHAARRYHQWDGKNTTDLKDFVQYIMEDTKRSMVVSVIDAFQKDLIDSGVAEQSFPKSLIHGDFNDANFLLNDNFQVTGVIDFGDSVERLVLICPPDHICFLFYLFVFIVVVILLLLLLLFHSFVLFYSGVCVCVCQVTPLSPIKSCSLQTRDSFLPITHYV